MSTDRTTAHRVDIGDARHLAGVADASIHLVVTSPPYPMIEMWDDLFATLAPESVGHLARGDGMAAFEAQHRALDEAWSECRRVLVPGGFLAVNIGDATRTLGEFCLYPNHARILSALVRLGLTPLPDILWRKPTNAPNKFMGSGMLPAGAYVTYEHEYILLARKGGKRIFTGDERDKRSESAYFWEERNLWFSDVWSDLRGARQDPRAATRDRSAAFPFELPYRLVQMYSALGDTVLDPFAGSGTTLAAAAGSGRNSVGVEWDVGFAPALEQSFASGCTHGRARAGRRLADHLAFVAERNAEGKSLGHTSNAYGFPVMTRQEVDLTLWAPVGAPRRTSAGFELDLGFVSEPPVPVQGPLFGSTRLPPPT